MRSRRSANALSATAPSSSAAHSGRSRRSPSTSGTVSMSKHRTGVIAAGSTWRQELQRIDRLAAVTNLEMQPCLAVIGFAEVGDALSATHRLPLLYEDLLVVCISRDVVVVVLDDDQVAVHAQVAAAVDDVAIARRDNRVAL